jgi:hypothetical protein
VHLKETPGAKHVGFQLKTNRARRSLTQDWPIAAAVKLHF